LKTQTTLGTHIFPATIVIFIFMPLVQVVYSQISPLFESNFTAYQLLVDTRIINLLIRSLFLAIMVILTTTLISIPLALLFVYRKFTFSKGFLILCLIPFFIPPYIQSIVWIHLLGNEGWINQLFMSFLSLEQPPFSIYGFMGSVFVLSLWLYPIMLIHYLIAFSQGNIYLEVASLYQSRWMVFRKIIFPLGKHTFWSGIALTFVLALINFSVPGILELNVYPVEIFSQIGSFFNFSDASVLSIPYVGLAIGFVVLFITSSTKMSRFSLIHYRPGVHEIKSPTKEIIIAFLVLFLIITIILPIIVLIIETKSFTTFLKAIQNNWKSLLHSILLSFAGSILITAIGFYLNVIVKKMKTIRPIMLFVLTLPFFIYGGLYGIGLIELWNQKFLHNTIYGTFIIILLAYLRYLPIGFFLIFLGMIKVPGTFQEISMISGRKKSDYYYKVLIPLIKPALAGSLLISFIFCFMELDTTILIYPPGIETLPISIFSLLHYGANEMVAALCLIQVLVIVMLILVIGFWHTKGGKTNNFELKT